LVDFNANTDRDSRLNERFELYDFAIEQAELQLGMHLDRE
jgi:hypothetical protein